MDAKLLAWARAVKARRARARLPGHALPVLWLFTDARRLPDPRAAVARLPCGLCGVVLRHDGVPNRAQLGAALARICRARRLALCVAGDVRLAARLGAGVHLRDGRRLPGPRCGRMVTSSAHDLADLRRAARSGAALAFLSPAWPTGSHPGVATLGPLRWRSMARQSVIPVCALGGVDARRLQAFRSTMVCAGAGAIAALA